MEKIKNFLSKRDVYLIIAGFFIVFALIGSAIMGVFPFGTKTTATYDAWHQVCPLYNLVFDFFEGKSSLFYTNSMAGGINTFGVLTYYIISPFSMFFLLFGRGGVYHAYTLVLVLKLITIGIVSCFFIRKTFPKINKVYQIVLSILYATSGYFVFLHTWVTWIDFMIYMPLLFMAYKKLVNEEKFLPFSILMALIVFTCFGIGSFSFVLFFILFVAYALICLDKEKQKRVLTLTVVGLVVAIGFALGLMVPSFLQYLGSSRTTGFFSLFFSKPVFNINTTDKLATVAADGLLLLFALIYIIKCDKKDKLNKFLIFAFVLLLLVAIVDEINLLLNMGSYNSYAFRMGFIYGFLVFYLASKLINDKWVVFEDKLKSNKKQFIDFCIISGIFLVVLIIALLIISQIIAPYFANQQATLGVLGCYVLILALLFVPLILIMFNTKRGELSKKFLAVAVIVVSFVQVFINTGFSVFGNCIDTNSTASVSSALQNQNIKTEEMFKDASQVLSNNIAVVLGVNSYSIFSSSTDINLINISNNMGYANRNSGADSYGGTLLTDSILGYKYFLYDREQERPNLEFLQKCEFGENVAYLYKNKLSKNSGLIVDNNFSWEVGDDVVISTNNLYNSLGGSGEVLTKYSFFENEKISVTLNNITLTQNENSYTLSIIDSNKEAYLTITYVADKNSVVYLNSQNEQVNSLYSVLDKKVGEEFRLASYSLDRCLNDLGFVQSGDEISVDLRLTKNTTFAKTDKGALDFVVMDYDKVETLLNNFTDVNDFTISFVKNGFDVNLDAEEDQKLILTLPYSKNYLCTINDEVVEIENFNSMISLSLKNGENNIKLTYKNPYTKLMVICLVVGVVFAFLIIIAMKFFKEKIMKLSFLVRILSIVLAVVLLGFFYVFPIGTMIVKMCLGIF